MDIDHSLNTIRIWKTGYYYHEERKVLYSDRKKTTKAERQLRMIVKKAYDWADEFSETLHNFYLEEISRKMKAGDFPSDEPKDEMMEEALLGIRYGRISPQLLVGISTKKITRDDIRDDLVDLAVERVLSTIASKTSVSAAPSSL